MDITGVLMACAVSLANPHVNPQEMKDCTPIWSLQSSTQGGDFVDTQECINASYQALNDIATNPRIRELLHAPTVSSLNDGSIPLYFFQCKDGDKVVFDNLDGPEVEYR